MSTWLSFNEIPLRRAKVRLSRGLEPDTSVIEFPASVGLKLLPAPLVPESKSLARPDVAAEIGKTRSKALELVKELPRTGVVSLAEDDPDKGLFWRADFVLHVTRVETVFVDDTGAWAMWRAYLVDNRAYFSRGLVVRPGGARFNIRLPDGTLDRSTVKPSGAPYTLGEIMRDFVVPAMETSPKLAVYPPEWDEDVAARDWGELPLALAVLLQVVRDQGLEDPVLRLDGTIAIHAAGEGVVGFTLGLLDGKSVGGNLAPFSEFLRLSRDGTGAGFVREFTHPEPYLVVVGGPRITTVALDDWVPVVIVEGRVRLLNEGTVRALTNNRYGMTWLLKWLLAPGAYQHAAGAPQKGLTILREQGLRLWQMPGFSVFAEDGQFVKFGENGHLAPLLPQAETNDGRRRPVAVECPRFQAISRTFADETDEGLTFQAAVRKVVDVSTVFRNTDALRQFDNPEKALGLKALDLGVLGFKKIASDQLARLKREAAKIELAKTIDASAAGLWEQAFLEQLRASDATSGGASEAIFKAMQSILALEVESGRLGKSGEVQSPAARAAAKARAQSAIAALDAADRELERKAKENANLTTVGAKRGRELTAVVYRNVPRADDPGAQVYSDRLCIVRTSEIAATLKDPSVHAPFETSLVQGAVRVRFGARSRPKVDESFKLPNPVDQFGNEIEVPTPLGEQNEGLENAPETETVFSIAFKRTDRGKAEECPLAEAVKHAPPVRDDSRVELVPLSGQGNRAELVAWARSLAVARFRKAEVIDGETLVVARPHPCVPDGLVQSIEWTSGEEDGAPCGVDMVVQTGTSAYRTATGLKTRVRPSPPVPRRADDPGAA